MRALIARKVCRVLPPSLAYRLHHTFFPQLRGFAGGFREKSLFDGGWLSGDMTSVIEAQFALHMTANLTGMAIASHCLAKGDTVFEFGANVGTETLALAGLVGPSGRVVAVEANADNAALLGARVGENLLHQVVVIQKAVSDSNERVRICKGPANNTGLSFIQVGGSPAADASSPLVEAVTADELVKCLGLPKLLLMDLEGAECLALKGSSDLLSRGRPTIVLEVDSRLLDRLAGSVRELTGLLARHRYRLFDPGSWSLPEVSGGGTSGDLHADWLAIPEEQVATERAAIRRTLWRARLSPKIRHISPLW